MSKPREAFTGDDDKLLIKYIATYAPAKDGRMGNNLYKRLAENSSNKWPWSRRHPWQSWRERYKKEEARFDAEIRKYQKRHAIEVPEKNKHSEADHLPTKVKTQDVVKNESRERHDTNEDPPVKKIGPANAARKTMRSTDREALEEKVEIGQKRKATTEEKKEGERMEPKRRRVEENEELLPRHHDPVVDDEASADVRTSNTADANHLTSNSVPGLLSPQASNRSGEHIAVDSQAGYKSPARQEVAVQVSSSPSQDQEYQHVNDKLISAFRNLGRSIGREQLVEAIRWNGLDGDIEAMILAETQHLDGKDPDSEDREDREDTDTLSSRAMSPESTFDPDNILHSSHGGSDSGAVAVSHLAEEKIRNETVAKPAGQKTILRNMGNQKSNKKNRRDDEDVFASDTDAPDPERIARLGGITVTQTSQAGLFKTNRPRAPPQTTNGHFRPQHAPGKKGPPYKRIPDMNSDSDAESVATAAPPTTWPPPRQKKLSQPTTSDGTLSKLKVNEKNKAPEPYSVTSPAHENDDVTGTQAGSTNTHQLAQHAENIPNERTINPARGRVAPRPSPPREKEPQDIAKDIQAWREKTDVQVKGTVVVSPMPSASVNPFFVAEQEGPLSHNKAKGKTAPRIDHNRRQTFGGFTGKQALPPKEVDLRRTVGRRSIASGLPGSNQDLPRSSRTPDSATGSKLKHSRRSSLASSVASTIELLTDSDLPDVPILPDDGQMAMRIGFSHIFKAMADNHGVPEQWLRDTYKLLGSIRKTDELGRAAAIAAGEVGSGEGNEGELEVDSEGEGEDAGSMQDSPAPITTTASQRTPMQNEKLHLQGSSGRKAALNITPADESSVPRIRETYSPPRPSRAAKYARLKKEGREEEAKERERRRASSHSPSKRLETEPSHSSPVRPTSVYSDSPSASPVAINTSAKPTLVTHKEPWTAEEDEIIRRGDDEDALREIEERRGTGSVYERTIELTGDDLY